MGRKVCIFYLVLIEWVPITVDCIDYFHYSLPAESLVSIEAVVVKPVELVKACTVQEVELKIVKVWWFSQFNIKLSRLHCSNLLKKYQIHSISETEERLPFSIEDATRGEEEIEKGEKEGLQYNRVNLDTRLNNRIIDLRTITNQAIFRLQHAVSKLFREFLEVRDFTEIHSPKIIGAASEGGANVFRVSYFKSGCYCFSYLYIIRNVILIYW